MAKRIDLETFRGCSGAGGCAVRLAARTTDIELDLLLFVLSRLRSAIEGVARHAALGNDLPE